MDIKTNLENVPAQEFRRPNQTIAIAPQIGSGKITLVMRRLFAAMLYFGFKDGKRELYSRSLAELSTAAELKGQTMTELRETLEAMRVLKVDWNTETVAERRWTTSGLISHHSLVDNKITRSSRVEWSFPLPIQEGLLAKEFFTPMLLQMVTRLKSSSAVGLYDICAQYETNRHGKDHGLTTKKPWEWWHPRLTGNPPVKGEDGEVKLTDRHGAPVDLEYKFFKRDTLTPAIEEINTWTDLEIELVEHKVGRRIAEIQFKVRSKQKAEVPAVHMAASTASVDSAAMTAMLELGVAEPVARKLEKEKASGDILRAVTYTKQRAAETGKVKDPAAFFISAIEGGYATAKKPKVAAAPKPAVPKPAAEEPAKATESRLDAALRAYLELGEEQKAAVLKEFGEQCTNPIVVASLRTKGLSTVLVRPHFCAWYAEKIEKQQARKAA